MAANVESMFYVRETPWHGLGTKVQEAPTSKDALILAGLDWHVVQEPVYTGQNELVQGYKDGIWKNTLREDLWKQQGRKYGEPMPCSMMKKIHLCLLM